MDFDLFGKADSLLHQTTMYGHGRYLVELYERHQMARFEAADLRG